MRTALITGASQGVGAHIAQRLTDEGWSVTGVGRRPRSSLPGDVGYSYVQADLGRTDQLEKLLAEVGDVPDLVVHNAVVYPDRNSATLELNDLEHAFRVNALVPYLITRDLLAMKPAEKFLACVFVNSEAMFHANQNSAAYAASKAALKVLAGGLSESARHANAALSTLLLGPLADQQKLAELSSIADRKGLTEEQVAKLFLRRSNPDLVIDEFIDYESCFESVRYMVRLGRRANGMLCRLDGGSAGSLI